VAKMAGLHAEGITDEDLADVEASEILQEILVD
jgi:hypothetical protein